MDASLDIEFRARLRSYLARETSLAAFMGWFSAATWDADERMGADTGALADEILLSWAEYTSGHLTDQEVRARVEQLAHSNGALSPHLPRTGS